MNDCTARSGKRSKTSTISLYGTPLESTTYKFAKCLQKRFGIIKGVTDKSYITNSYHVHVTEEINAFDKLRVRGASSRHSLPAARSAMWKCPICSKTWRR